MLNRQLCLMLTIGIFSWVSMAHAGTDIRDIVKFSCSNTEQVIQERGAARVLVGNAHIYIGTEQVAANNQNPIIKAFHATTGAVLYCRTDYETTGVDGRGLGLHWNGTGLYGVFSVDGGSTTAFSAAASGNDQGWTRSYGNGGGPKIGIVARLDPANGDVTGAAFLRAQLSNGRTNSLAITDIGCQANGNLRVVADSYYSPLYINGSRMPVSGDSPFGYTVELTPDLKTVVYTEAQGYSAGALGAATPCPASTFPSFRAQAADVNGDGYVTPVDAIYVAKNLNTNDPTADVDGSGTVTESDLNWVVGELGTSL